MTAGFVALVEEFLFRGVLLGLAIRGVRTVGARRLEFRWLLRGPLFKARKTGRRCGGVVVGIGADRRIRRCRAATLAAVVGLCFPPGGRAHSGTATLRTRSLWLAIGLHAGWIFCQQALQWLARYRVKPPDALWPWIGAERSQRSSAHRIAASKCPALDQSGLWYYLRNASADARGS